MGRISNAQKFWGIFFIVVFLAAGAIGLTAVFPSASNIGYAPEQPIPFSHKIHAGINKIDCKYCHTAPERSRHSTIPSLNICMNCHRIVRAMDSPLIQKVKEAYDAGKPIEWVRVHELPDHVYFAHNRHIAAGLQCQTCHGNVQEMDVIQQVSSLTMGWCMSCHRGETTPKDIIQRFGKPDAAGRTQVAPVDCTTCHQ